MEGWPGSTLKKKQIKKLIVPSERDLFFLRKEFCFRSDESLFSSEFEFLISPVSIYCVKSRILRAIIFKA